VKPLRTVSGKDFRTAAPKWQNASASSDFFQKSERAHCTAPPFQIEPAALGFDLILDADLEASSFLAPQSNLNNPT
jgi:hypothetical protein